MPHPQHEIYSIRIQTCQKCYEHNHYQPNSISKSYHINPNNMKTTRNNNEKIVKKEDFIQEQQEYKKQFQNLLKILDQLQQQFLQHQHIQNKKFNYQLKKRKGENQESKEITNNVSPSKNKQGYLNNQKQEYNLLKNIPVFKILKNKPYNYLAKLPDTKISTKRYLNNTTNKIVQFPKKDSFEIYFENLLVFSKLSYQKWPNLNLIAIIIKKLVLYCQKDGPLMLNLNKFINNYLDIKSLDQNLVNCNVPLYNYLIIFSNVNATGQLIPESLQQITSILDQIIEGRTKVYSFNQSVNQKNIHQITKRNATKRDILPYTLCNPKIKATTMESIYLSKQNKIKKTKMQKRLKTASMSSHRFNDKRNIIIMNSTLQDANRKTRPLSSNLGYIQKKSSSFGIKTKNEVFQMIKMGDIQQNLFKANQKPFMQIQMNKQLSNELRNLCNINKSKIKNNLPIRASKQNKIYFGNKYNAFFNKIQQKQHIEKPITQNQQHQFNSSIVWTKFERKSVKQNRKNSKKKENSEVSNQNQGQNLLFKTFESSPQKESNYEKGFLKVSPSKMTKRASHFLNQKQQKLLKNELKNLAADHLNKARMSQCDNIFYSKNLQRKNSVQRKKSVSQHSNSFSSSSSSSKSSIQQNNATEQFGETQMKQSYKLKVLRNNLQKRRSQKSRSSQDSSESNNNKDTQKQSLENIQPEMMNSLVVKSPTKLSVKSRRKSSFYYSNTKNNSLLQLIKGSQLQKDSQKQKKKLKKRASIRESKVQIQTVQEGIQVNCDEFKQLKNSDENGICEKSIQKQQIISSTNLNLNILGSKTSLPPRQSTQTELQDKKKSIQIDQLRQNGFYLSKTIRDSRVSNLSRISKFSFQNHLNAKDQSNGSKQKDANGQLVAVFPENKFSHAFIVNKFSQKQNYELQIKKMFTTNLNLKNEIFDFQIKCQEVCRVFEVRSLNKIYQNQETEAKLRLFPKIFQQIQRYSTPLAQVVNRLMKFHPITISRLFTNAHGISPLGQYCIWIYYKDINQWKPVYVNDYVPFFKNQNEDLDFLTDNKNKCTVYAPLSNQNSIWFILLEKALAKVFGSYYKLKQIAIGQLFSMLTGCPTVNIKSFTANKLKKIFNQRVFQNKKAYVYTLNKQNQSQMKIDRIVGLAFNQKNQALSLAKIEDEQNSQIQVSLQTLIRKYSEISLIFFNINYFYNQISIPVLKKQQKKVSNVVSFYIFNEQIQDKNDIYICLGGFGKGNLSSKIIIYQQAQDQQDADLKQLQVTDPLTYYEQKYIYQGEIKKKGNYFFQTSISYGKFLCLIQADFKPEQQYFISVYSFKPININNINHNFSEQEKKTVDPLQKIIKNNQLRRKLKKQKLETIDQDETLVHTYPIRVKGNRRDSSDQLLPYDFSHYQQDKTKVKKVKNQDSMSEIQNKGSKWVIQKQFVEDEQLLQQKRQQYIANMITKIQKSQHKNEFCKLKKQLGTNDKDVILKMMNRMNQNTKKLANKKFFAKSSKVIEYLDNC